MRDLGHIGVSIGNAKKGFLCLICREVLDIFKGCILLESMAGLVNDFSNSDSEEEEDMDTIPNILSSVNELFLVMLIL